MSEGYCLIYRNGDAEYSIDKFAEDLRRMMEKNVDSSHCDVVQNNNAQDISGSVETEDPNINYSSRFLLWYGEKNISVSVRRISSDMIVESYNLKVLDIDERKNFIDLQVKRFITLSDTIGMYLVSSYRGDMYEDDWDSILSENKECVPDEEPDIIAAKIGLDRRLVDSFVGFEKTEYSSATVLTL